MRKKIIAVLLACMMAASVVPMSVSATGEGDISSTPAAGDVQRANPVTTADDLQQAITSSQSAVTITLGANITDSITIPADKDVTIDLNGHSITNSAGNDTITVAYNGSLTINGTGTVDNVSHGKAAIYNSGTVILNGGTYTRSLENGSTSENSGGNSFYNILNHGRLTINSPVSVCQSGRYSSLIENGYQNYKSENARSGYVEGENHTNPTLKINGGNFTGGINTVKNDDGGTLEIYDGTFSNTGGAAVMNWNNATIYGGTYSVAAGAVAVLSNGYINETLDVGNLTVKGGTFIASDSVGTLFANGQGAIKDFGTLTITGGDFTGNFNDAVTFSHDISGGSFSSDVPESYLADTVGATLKTGSRMAVYTDLQDAVDAASSGDTVVVRKNNLSAIVDPNEGIKFETAENISMPVLNTPSGEEVEIENGNTVQTTFSATINGTSTSYKPGAVVPLNAAPYTYDGRVFVKWVDRFGNASIDAPYSPTTTFTMPKGDVEINAYYTYISYTPVVPDVPDYTPVKPVEPAGPDIEWVSEDGNTYLYVDDKMITGWYENEDGWYWFDEDTGVMSDDCWEKIDGVWYLFDEDGIMLTGWQKVDGKWYYLKPWGGMATGWQLIDSVWYYLRGDGSMAANAWVQSGGYWYYLTGSGEMATASWIEWKGDWYYLYSSGIMATNTTIDGCYIDSNGIWRA